MDSYFHILKSCIDILYLFSIFYVLHIYSPTFRDHLIIYSVLVNKYFSFQLSYLIFSIGY